MKVLLPSLSTHTIIIEPRYYTSNAIDLYSYNEATKEDSTQVVTSVVNSGVMSVTFDLDVLEGDKFTFKMSESGNIIYRCKVIATEQNPQDYKLTNGKYKVSNV